MPAKKQYAVPSPEAIFRKKKNIITSLDNINLDDYSADLDLLEELIQEEMYEKSEKSLYSFFINFWNTFDPQPLVNNWHIQCLCEHIQAALNREIRRLIINIPPRSCLVPSTIVQLSNGQCIQIKDIEPGMEVISTDGIKLNKNKVLDKWSVGIKKVLKLTFNDGNYLKCTPEHKILTPDGFIKASDLLLHDIVYNHAELPIQSDFYLDLDDAFLLGLWIAEGFKTNKSHFAFANDTPEIINKAISIAESKGWRYRYDKEFTHRFINPEGEIKGAGIKGSIRQWLETYLPDSEYPSNCYDVRIPSCIFRASREAKIEFLNAFIACDGWIDTHSGKIATEVASENLAKDIYRLFKQLGYNPTLKTRHRKHTYAPQGKVNCATHYSCTISRNKDLQKAKSDFNFYHKQIKLLSIKEKNRSNERELPTKYLTSSNSYTKALQKHRFAGSNILYDDKYNYSKKEQYLNGLRFVEITNIEQVPDEECFDIEVENDHTFFADNIAVSNSKSTTASIASPVWQWLKHPDEKFWLVSHSEKLYAQNIGYARKILDHPTYKNRWCNPKEEDYYRFSLEGVDRVTRVENSEGGYLLGGSPGAKVLGMGYTVAILDDLLDSQESNSREAVEGVNSWYTQTFLNRTNDVNNDVIILVMQRLAEDDITDYVMKTYPEQDWFLLNLPAKYDPTRTFVSPIGFNDRRKVRNQLLDPVRLPDHFLVTQAKNPIIYNTRYQQNPTAGGDGNLVKAEWIQEENIKPITYSVQICVWDLNITETPESDYTVGLVIGKHEDEYHIIDMWRKQVDIPQQLDAIKRLHRKYPKAIVGIEARANGHAAMSLLKREIPEIYAFEPRKFGGKKEARLGSVLPYFRDKKVFIYNPFFEDNKLEDSYSADQIIKELKGFPLASTDDIVDCVGYGIAYLAEYGQENTALISNGNKITIFEEDYVEEKEAERIQKLNLLNYEFSQENIPTRDFIQNLNW